MRHGTALGMKLLLLVCVVLLMPRAGRTQNTDGSDLPIVLDSEGECGTRTQIISKVTAIFGELPILGEHRRFHGTVARKGSGWTATLDTSDNGETFTRTVSVNSCEGAVEVLSLLIALAIDPVAVMASEDEGLQTSLDTLAKSDAESAEAPPPVEPDPEEPPQPIDSEPPPVEPKPEKTLPSPMPPPAEPGFVSPSVRVGVDFDADVGVAGLFRPGVAVFGAFSHKLFRTELSFRFLPTMSWDEAAEGEAQYVSRLFGFSLGGGLQLNIRRLGISPMLGVGVHGLYAESEGVIAPGEGHAWFVSVWLGVAVEWAVADWLGLRFFPALHWLPPPRPRFEIEGTGLIYQPSPVAGMFNFGVFLHF